MSIANMVDVYYQLVKLGSRSLNQVPTAERPAVKAKLDADASAAQISSTQEV